MKLIAEFRKFALRGSLIDMAVGFTVGAAFTTVARSLVDNIIMPVVGLVLGSADFSDFFILLKAGPKTPPPYHTLEAAEKAGAVTLNYGLFINQHHRADAGRLGHVHHHPVGEPDGSHARGAVRRCAGAG